ncbi:MAG: hypothetical protein NTU53_14800 [Planctomycetota bacterium]|nr:hypothetical protein [Planctomycetota bacterium]
MERLLTMDKEQFISEMQAQVRQILGRVADAVNNASRKTLGEKTEAGKKWVHEVLHALRHEGYEPFFQKLVDWRSGLRGGKRKEADRLLNDLAERQAMMDYAECERRGWDVGTARSLEQAPATAAYSCNIVGSFSSFKCAKNVRLHFWPQ